MIVGAAEVEIRADASDFGSDAEKQIRSQTSGFRDAGHEAGTAFGTGFTDTVRRDLTGLDDDASRAGTDAGQEFGQGFSRGADNQLRDASDSFDDLEDDAAREGRRAGDAYGDAFSREADRSVDSGRGRLTGTFGKIGVAAAGAFAAAFAAVQLVGLFGGVIQEASDLQESASKVGIVFGDAADEVLRFGDNAAESFGQSEAQALAAAGTFGNLLRSIGLTEEESAQFSITLTGLASDLASFNNTTTDEALDALRSGLVGETEPLKRFGVNLNDAALKAKALELGLSDGKGVLDAAAKSQAAYALILEQTGLAQGDFERTSGGLANQQRILGAQWDDLKGRVGTALLPSITGVVTVINDELIPALAEAGPAFDVISEAGTAFLDGFKGTTDVGEVSGALGGLSDAGVLVRSVFDGILDVLGPVIAAFLSAGQTIVASFGLLRGPIADFAAVVLPVFRDLGDKLVGVLVPGFQKISATISTKFIPAIAVILPLLAPVAKFLIETLGGAIVGALSGVIKVIDGVITVISGLISFIAAVFTGNWSAAWQALKDIASGAFTAIIGAIQVFLNVGILKAFRLGLSLLAGLWRGGLALLRGIAEGLWKGLVALFTGALRGIGSLLIGAVRGYVNLWRTGLNGLVSGLRFVLDSAIAVVRGLPGRVVTALGNLSRLLYTSGQKLIQGLIDGILSKIRAVGEAAGQIAGKIKGFFGGSPVEEGPLVSWNDGGAGKNLISLLVDGLEQTQPVAEASRDIAEIIASSVPANAAQLSMLVTGATSGLTGAAPIDPAIAAALARSGGRTVQQNVSLSTRVTAPEVVPYLEAYVADADALFLTTPGV